MAQNYGAEEAVFKAKKGPGGKCVLELTQAHDKDHNELKLQVFMSRPIKSEREGIRSFHGVLAFKLNGKPAVADGEGPMRCDLEAALEVDSDCKAVRVSASETSAGKQAETSTMSKNLPAETVVTPAKAVEASRAE